MFTLGWSVFNCVDRGPSRFQIRKTATPSPVLNGSTIIYTFSLLSSWKSVPLWSIALRTLKCLDVTVSIELILDSSGAKTQGFFLPRAQSRWAHATLQTPSIINLHHGDGTHSCPLRLGWVVSWTLNTQPVLPSRGMTDTIEEMFPIKRRPVIQEYFVLSQKENLILLSISVIMATKIPS